MSSLRTGGRKSLLMIVFLLLATCFLMDGLALASEAAQGADRSGDLLDLLSRFINFILLVAILFWVIRKFRVKDLLAGRVEDLRQRMESLKREKEGTEQKYLEAERQLREFEERRKEILEQFKQEGLAEKEKIVAEARDRASQITEQAGLTIQQEMQSTMDRLKQEVVDLAAQKAEEIISKGLTDKDQDNLVNEFIERVDKIH